MDPLCELDSLSAGSEFETSEEESSDPDAALLDLDLFADGPDASVPGLESWSDDPEVAEVELAESSFPKHVLKRRFVVLTSLSIDV